MELDIEVGDLVAAPSTLPERRYVATLMLDIPNATPEGLREAQLTTRVGGVSRVRMFQANVVEPDARGIELLAQIPLPLLGVSYGNGNDIWGWSDPLTGARLL